MSALRDTTNLLPVDDLVREFRAEFSKVQQVQPGLALGQSLTTKTAKKNSGKKKTKQESACEAEGTADGPAMPTTSTTSRPCLRESTRMASFASRRLARATEPTGAEKEDRKVSEVEEDQHQERSWTCERIKKAVRVYSRKRISRVGSR